MRQKLWRKKKFVVMAAAFACIAALSACGKKDTDYNVDVGNGDGGSVQSKYSIPESCDTTFDAGSTGLKEIRLTRFGYYCAEYRCNVCSSGKDERDRSGISKKSGRKVI